MLFLPLALLCAFVHPTLTAAPEQRERLEQIRATSLSELHHTAAAYADTLRLAPEK